MKKTKNWRFKTKEEFIQEFGKDWPVKVSYGWVDDVSDNISFDDYTRLTMNHFLGQPFTGEVPQKNNSVFYHNWNIGLDMLTTRQLPKILSDGTIVKVGMKLLWDESPTNGVLVNKIYGDWAEDEIEIFCLCPICEQATIPVDRIALLSVYSLRIFKKQPKA
jgi:hypothetical protein